MKLSTEKLRFLTVETHVTKNGSFLKTPFINRFVFGSFQVKEFLTLPKKGSLQIFLDQILDESCDRAGMNRPVLPGNHERERPHDALRKVFSQTELHSVPLQGTGPDDMKGFKFQILDCLFKQTFHSCVEIFGTGICSD